AERALGRLEGESPLGRVVRLRLGLLFRRESASEIRRLFLGPFFPNALVRRALLPVVPAIPDLRVQAVHSEDVGRAYALATTGTVRGSFNIAAEPVLDAARIARELG